MAERAKLDMNHGFIKSIVRNQIDRDNYDKEVKMEKANKVNKSPTKNNQKPKKPDVKVYQPPMHRTTKEAKKPVFIVEYEDQSKKIFNLPIFEDSDLEHESIIFSRKVGICEPLIKPLHLKLIELMNEYKK